MCVIIDANCASKMATGAEDAKPIVQWLAGPKGHIAIGGAKLGEEYAKVEKFVKFLVELERANKIYRYDKHVINAEEKVVLAMAGLKSDDPHILALARISGARLIFSHDKDLHADFTNSHIIQPKGAVYQNANHKHLLNSASQCS